MTGRPAFLPQRLTDLYGPSASACFHGLGGATARAIDPAPCQAYQGCAAGQPVVWCAFEGGHEVPPWTYAAVMGFFRSLP